MSSSYSATANRSDQQSWDGCGGSWGKRGNWTGMNIAVMVVGFVFFWPVGLLVLYWIIKGRDVRDLPHAVRVKSAQLFNGGSSRVGGSDNVVFNDYQQTQYDRIREIKSEISERQRRFSAFQADVKRRADEEEFNRFMADAPVRGES